MAGHTDNQKLSKALRKTFPNNKALSWARAENARRALINGGLPADVAMAVGFADSKPVAPNTTESGRQKNRRVELVISQWSMAKTGPAEKGGQKGAHVAALAPSDKAAAH